MLVKIIAATTLSPDRFFDESLLGKSISLFPASDDICLEVIPDNHGLSRRGLPSIYNEFLARPLAPGEPDVLLFVHDDVYIHDWNLVSRLRDAMCHYDVVGLAGNINPDLDEPSWALAFNKERYPSGWQPAEFLSGNVAHLSSGTSHVTVYGATPQACMLLDGLFLAVNKAAVADAMISFDEQFDFHFYDLDFCRQCTAKGLRLGTWPISVTHASGGSFGSQEWKDASETYLSKWKSRESSVVQHPLAPG